MKKVLLVLVMFLMFPLVAFAQGNAEVKSITFVEKSENTKVVSEATTDGEKINLDLVFYDQGDYATYDVVVKNKASEKLYINGDIFKSDDEHISYGFSYDGNKNYINPGEEQTITLTATYSKAIEKEEFGSGGVYEASTDAPLILSNKLISVANTLKNLGIASILLIGFIGVCIIIGLYQIVKNRKANELTLIVLLLTVFAIPTLVSALLMVEIPVEATITIKKVKDNPCTYDGELTQGVEKVVGQYTYRYKQQRTYNGWENITDDGWGMALTDRDSTDPVTSKMCTYINDKPIVSLSDAFYGAKTSSIDFSSFDTSSVKNMYQFLYNSSQNAESVELKDIEYLDVSNVENMGFTFYQFGTHTNGDISLDLRKWDVSNVKNTQCMFQSFGDYSHNATLNVSGWDLKSVTVIDCIFWLIGNHLSGEAYLDVSNLKINPTITSLFQFFYSVGQNSLKVTIDVTGFDTSHITNASSLFIFVGNGNTDIEYTRIIGLNTLDLSNVTSVSAMFCMVRKLELNGFAVNFDDISSMFGGARMITGNIVIKKNPTNYGGAFNGTFDDPDYVLRVDYTSAVTEIDDILATKISQYHPEQASLVKGNLVED